MSVYRWAVGGGVVFATFAFALMSLPMMVMGDEASLLAERVVAERSARRAAEAARDVPRDQAADLLQLAAAEPAGVPSPSPAPGSAPGRGGASPLELSTRGATDRGPDGSIVLAAAGAVGGCVVSALALGLAGVAMFGRR